MQSASKRAAMGGELAEAEQRLESLRATLDDQRLLLQDMAGDTIGIQ
ncbi:hypothetical protein ACT691_16760 [Vibrio metschnikovii]